MRFIVTLLICSLMPWMSEAQTLSLKEFLKLAEENDPEFKRID